MEKVTFRAHGVGALMKDKRGAVITENQLKTLNDYQDRIRKGGTLTSNQREKLKELKAKRDAPFQFADTAVTFINKTWLLHNKGFWKLINSKFLDKGLYSEEDGISLVSEVDGRFYAKNTERQTKGHITGECDIKNEIDGKVIVQDVKCCWDAETFINAKLDDLYEWQGRSYMHLYDADEFWLRFCLVDCPPHIYEYEKYKLKSKYNIIDEDVEGKELIDQLHRNLVFSDNPAYSKSERVKTIKLTRDMEKENQLLTRVSLAAVEYNKITLNRVVNG